MKFGACIDTLYTEIPWYDRITAAGRDGFYAIEFWDWRNIDISRTREYARIAGVVISGFNGDADFSPINPSHKNAYLDFLHQSLNTAEMLGASSVTIHSNALGKDGVVVNNYDSLSNTTKLCALFDTLKAAALMAEKAGIQLNLEALNIHTDHTGNFLTFTKMAADICRLIASPNLKILYDVYHMQINEGHLTDNIREHIDVIGHVHIADVPGRHEPGTGEINYVNVLRSFKHYGYDGIIGCELFPQSNSISAISAIMALKRAVAED